MSKFNLKKFKFKNFCAKCRNYGKNFNDALKVKLFNLKCLKKFPEVLLISFNSFRNISNDF